MFRYFWRAKTRSYLARYETLKIAITYEDGEDLGGGGGGGGRTNKSHESSAKFLFVLSELKPAK